MGIRAVQLCFAVLALAWRRFAPFGKNVKCSAPNLEKITLDQSCCILARARSAEYLYAEELEALSMGDDALLSALRLAFSRDQAQKIYVQHLLRDDGASLRSALLDQGGSFYLCGPTWPVADVRAALLVAFGAAEDADAA